MPFKRRQNTLKPYLCFSYILTQYDTVIIGAGHNGLVCAAYLARKNQNVLILEASEQYGGLARTVEFHPGFKAAVAHHARHFPNRISRDLRLEQHGLTTSKNIPCIGLGIDGDHVILEGEQLVGISAEDQQSFGKYNRLMRRFAEKLAPFWLKTVPRIGHNSLGELLSFAHLGLNLRLLGQADMREFFRMITLPMHDLTNEYFTHPGLKAMLSWDALIGSKQAPRSPNNSVFHLLYRMASDSSATTDVEGLITSLYTAAVSLGVEIRTSTPVVSIEIDQDGSGMKAVGVRLENGELVTARNIASSADPKTTFLKLLGAQFLEIEFTNRIARIRSDGLVSKLNLALSGLPDFKGLDKPEGRLFIAPSLESIEWAFDDAKYGKGPSEPVIEITIPTLQRPDHAPEGSHVLSAQIMYTPYKHEDQWSEHARTELIEKTIDAIARYAPGIRGQIVSHELLTPTDLESQYLVHGGHWHHGDFALDQMLMMRPTYGAAQYRTPIEGLFLCGAGSHPGGDITGMPGHNAAKEILS